ncbi:MAG: hypothetical protein EHM58_16085 [Ignavibacteriae bacterium]|nr:MAG: hypothetical protein EHM58_16085 [Ignavibacteriota bacterium]
MTRNKIFLFLAVIVMFAGFNSKILAQSSPVLYFCESYTSTDGEVNISDRFYPGYLTVMVKSDTELGLRDCSIQFDKYNPRTTSFEYYKKFEYEVKPTMKYIFFEKNSSSDLSFDEPGIYRVFLLDNRDRTVASALIEIIPR